jgi:hypothetical protein
MIYTLVLILVALWLLGIVTSYTMGGFIHLLIIIAVVMVIFNVANGRKA